MCASDRMLKECVGPECGAGGWRHVAHVAGMNFITAAVFSGNQWIN